MPNTAEAVINKLITITKRSSSLHWDYLDKNSDLMQIVESVLEDHMIDSAASFSYEQTHGYKTGYFVIAQVFSTELPILFLVSVPSLGYRDNCVLNKEDECQKDLLRLHNLVRRQFPNTEDFISYFLEDSD